MAAEGVLWNSSLLYKGVFTVTDGQTWSKVEAAGKTERQADAAQMF